jgi:hypothetical protein
VTSEGFSDILAAQLFERCSESCCLLTMSAMRYSPGKIWSYSMCAMHDDVSPLGVTTVSASSV